MESARGICHLNEESNSNIYAFSVFFRCFIFSHAFHFSTLVFANHMKRQLHFRVTSGLTVLDRNAVCV